MSEAKVQEELAYWNLGSMEDLDVVDTLEEDDTESDSPAKMFGVPSNVRLAVDASAANSRYGVLFLFCRGLANTEEYQQRPALGHALLHARR